MSFRWIACADEMPRPHELVLFAGTAHDGRRFSDFGSYSEHGSRWTVYAGAYDDGGSYAAKDISHWAPLPEPPP